MGSRDDVTSRLDDAEAAPILVTRLFRAFPQFVEQYVSRVALSGAFVTAVEPLPVGTSVHLDFQLRDGFRLFHGVGEVAWVRPSSLGPDLPAGMGIRFQALDEKGRSLLLRMLEEHIKAGGHPFDLDPVPEGATTDPHAVPRRDEGPDDDETLGLDIGAEPETPEPAPATDPIDEAITATLPEGPVSEIVDVSFATVDPASRPAMPTESVKEPTEVATKKPAEEPAAPSDDPIDVALDPIAFEATTPVDAPARVAEPAEVDTAAALFDLDQAAPINEVDEPVDASDASDELIVFDAIEELPGEAITLEDGSLDETDATDEVPRTDEPQNDEPRTDEPQNDEPRTEAPAVAATATGGTSFETTTMDEMDAFEVPDFLDPLELPDALPDVTAAPEAAGAEAPLTAAREDSFDPPWKSKLPDIPEEFLAAEESVGSDELAAIAAAAEAASRVELPLEAEPEPEVPASALFDTPVSADTNVLAPITSPAEAASLDAPEPFSFDGQDPQTPLLAEPTEPAVESPTGLEMPDIDFGVEEAAERNEPWAQPSPPVNLPPTATEIAAEPSKPVDLALPEIPPPAPLVETAPVVLPADNEAVKDDVVGGDAVAGGHAAGDNAVPDGDEVGDNAVAGDVAMDPGEAPYWLDETGAASTTSNPWPARIGLVVFLALAVVAALWFLRDRLFPVAPAPTVAAAAAPSDTQPAEARPPEGRPSEDQRPETGASPRAIPEASAADGATTEAPPTTTDTLDPTSATARDESTAGSTTAPPTLGTTTSQPAPSAARPEPAPPRPATTLPPATLVTGIDWNETDNGTLVTLALNGSMATSRLAVSELGGASPRILVIATGIDAPYADSVMAVGGPLIQRIRTGFHPRPRGNELHIVIDLASQRAGLAGDALPGADGRVELLIAPL